MRLALLLTLLLVPAAGAAPAGDPRGTDLLQLALVRYRAIETRGGWPRIPTGETLRTGSNSYRVAYLRARLAAEGYLLATLADSNPRFDTAVAVGLRRYQERNGLDTDAVLGRGTLAMLNVPVATRIRQLERNIERRSLLPADLGSRYVLVNIPEFRLRAFEGGRIARDMRIIVGADFKERGTPTFSDTMRYVIFSPYWYVPASIAREEIVPDARADSTYLANRGFEVVGNTEADAQAMLEEIEAGRATIRRRPGRGNPLGKVKFIFPNHHAVYLHDTSERHLFARARRAFSHGCIRVQHPVELAQWILPEWSREAIEKAMDAGRERHVTLANKIPIHIVYWTATVAPDGTASFFEDLYRQDEGR